MSEQIDSPKVYVTVWIALLAFTLLTTLVATVDLGFFNVVVALVIAGIKMLLVALFFMHLRHSTVLMKVVVGGGLLWLAIMLGLSATDYGTRGWL
jgi:cytochrome c oxidase subunit IV